MKLAWSIVLSILAVLSVLLGWMGVKSIAHGFDDAAGLSDGTKGVYLLLGFFQLFGAALALFGLVRFARTWRILPGASSATEPSTSIRERALANQRAAQSSQR
ncbi:MAG: hypothetical protein IPJ77_06175 [Planctomycetes bacterium]|nr:hypothetical protein [Planctomycetota bacterium]